MYLNMIKLIKMHYNKLKKSRNYINMQFAFLASLIRIYFSKRSFRFDSKSVA